MFKRPLLTIVAVLLLPYYALAIQLYGIVSDDCSRETGLIVYADEDSFYLIGLDGQLNVMNADEVDAVLIYNTFDNPISKINLSGGAGKYLRKVYLDAGGDPTAIAWPIHFIEDLVVFYDINGKTHVYSNEQINRLRPSTDFTKGIRRNHAKRVSFDYSSAPSKCDNLAKSKGSVRPTRILADKIKLGDFFSSLREGYLALDGFQERTYLYAKPFLYEKSSRLGFIFESKDIEEEGAGHMPMYFQWSKGRPYKFQSFTVIGGKPNEFLPNAESLMAIRSDVKSHIFHGFLAGNLLGMSAGSSIFRKSGDLDKEKGEVSVEPSFNYMALMGGDFGPYSASFGYFFPTFGIKAGDEFREVKGGTASFALRLMYTKPRYRLRAIASVSEYNVDSPTQDDLEAWSAGGLDLALPDRVEFSSRFVRGGIDFGMTDDISFGLDGIILDGSYEERVSATENSISFRRFTTAMYAKQSFSDYTTVTLYWNLYKYDYESNFSGVQRNKTKDKSLLFGSFEFVF